MASLMVQPRSTMSLADFVPKTYKTKKQVDFLRLFVEPMHKSSYFDFLYPDIVKRILFFLPNPQDFNMYMHPVCRTITDSELLEANYDDEYSDDEYEGSDFGVYGQDEDIFED
jgi:hypothetical protein